MPRSFVTQCSVSPFGATSRNAFTNPNPSTWATVPVAAMTHAEMDRLPVRSGSTRRLDRTWVRKCQPWLRTAFRFSFDEYQESKHTYRGEPAGFGGDEHLPKVLVLVPLGGLGGIDEAVVGRVHGIAVGPGEGDQVDPPEHPLVLARPEGSDESHRVGVRLVEDGVIDDEDAVGAADVRAHFPPEGFGVGFESGEQAGEGVVGGGVRVGRLDAGGLARARLPRRPDEEVDVVPVGHPRRIHARKSTAPSTTAQGPSRPTA